MMLNWRIYYDDGSTFDSSDGAPEDAPAFGVQCIVERDPDVGRIILADDDWYYFDVKWGRWLKSDLYGMLDKLLARIDIVGVMSGRNAQPYREIMALAKDDADFPVKSATKSRELRK